MELTGHIDGLLIHDSEAMPFDVKSVNPHDFQRIGSARDLASSGKAWLQKWPAQVLLYCLMSNHERGFLYLKNKITFEPKVIWFDLNDAATLDYAEGILRRLETINRHVREGTLPPVHDDPDTCRGCPFFHVCLPEIKREALELLESTELEAKLRRRAELEAAAREYEALDREVRQALQGRERAIVGDWLIVGRPVTRKSYTVPETTYWQIRITPLTPAAAAEGA
jgi:hypothetical protein